MRRIAFIILAAITALGINARSLEVTIGGVSYSFPASGMGSALHSADQAEFVILDKHFPLASITAMKVVENDMKDNTLEVTYDGSAATARIAGNIARYIDVTISGADVTVTQSSEVNETTCGEITYRLSGKSTNGSFAMTGDYKAEIDLEGLDLTSTTGAALDIQNGKRIAISSKNGTVNTLVDAAAGSQKGAIVCKGHIEFKGKGSLTVTGNKSHAIYAKEYVTVKNCSLTVSGAVKDGINCCQYFAMESGTVRIDNVGDDGIQVDYKDAENREDEDTGSVTVSGGTLTVAVTATAAKGVKAEGDLNISGGTLTLSVSGGGKWDSAKSKTKASSCLGADGDVNITGGDMNLTATGSGGKGISCDGTLNVKDGKITIRTSGGIFAYVNGKEYDNYTGNTDNLNSDYKSSPKGIKADTFISIDGGNINVTTTGNGAEGIESKGELTINGGEIFVKAYDDAINSSSHMNINGGNITVISYRNDGLDANGNVVLTGGYVRAFGGSSPECGIDANSEQGYTVIFTGGTLLAVGGGNSLPTTSQSTQPYISASTTARAGNTVQLKQGDTVLAEFTIPTEYGTSASSWAAPGRPGGSGGGFAITCPGLTSGSSYTLVNGTSTTNVTAVTSSGSTRPW